MEPGTGFIKLDLRDNKVENVGFIANQYEKDSLINLEPEEKQKPRKGLVHPAQVKNKTEHLNWSKNMLKKQILILKHQTTVERNP